jgi:hypothetical protein
MLVNLRIGLIALLLAATVAACGPATTMKEVWKEPSYTPKQSRKVLVIGLAENERNRNIFEEAMQKQLAMHHVETVMGSKTLPADPKSVDQEALKQQVRATGADLALVTRVIGVDKETQYVPGSTYYAPAPGYYGFYGYYYSSYSVVSDPGYLREYQIVKVETNVYDVATEKLVWSGVSHTEDPSSVTQTIDEVSATFVAALAADKIIASK